MEFFEEADRYVLRASQWLARPRGEVFAFFARADNLQRITPPWLHLEITSPRPIEMAVGTLIDYRLRVHGLPMKWRSRITVWRPGERFVDQQLIGPYRLWRHEHTFHDEAGGTRLDDEVTYRVPGGPLAPLLHRWFVQRDLRKVFTYRHEVVAGLMGGDVPEAVEAEEPA